MIFQGTEAEFKEFEPRLIFKPGIKYGWFHLKLGFPIAIPLRETVMELRRNYAQFLGVIHDINLEN